VFGFLKYVRLLY